MPSINDDNDDDERKVFEKVPDEMAEKLNEIINEAVPYLFLLFNDVGCNGRGKLSGFTLVAPSPPVSVSRPDSPFGWFSSDRLSRVIGVD